MNTNKRIALLSLDNTDWQSHKNLYEFESLLSYPNTVAFNSVQTALQATLELLGTRTHMHPVIMPVTAPPDTVAAALRAGSQPLLLDVDEDTLQIQLEQLNEALEALEDAIVVLHRPGGLSVSDELLEALADRPTVLDARQVPHPQLGINDLVASFNVFDLTQLVGTGGVVIHKFKKQVEQLRIVRSGIMGHSGTLCESAALLAKECIITHFSTYCQDYLTSINEYKKLLYGVDNIHIYEGGKWPTPLYIRVPNAQVVIAQLASYNIEAALGCYPLYNIEEIRIRYKEQPDYPVAESLSNQVVALPTHKEANVSLICNIIKEIVL